MYKRRSYYNTKFPPETIYDAFQLFLSKLDSTERNKKFADLTIRFPNEEWQFDSIEEFFAEYPKAEMYVLDYISKDCRFIINNLLGHLYVRVDFPNRVNIETIFQVFERNLEKSIIKVETESLKIFIGHGHDNQWKELKDHLHEKHGFDVIAYEIGPRAGLSIKEVLESMLNESSIAFLILTGEDSDAYGEKHARENVIHELGLFQGRLGFKRAIAILEEDVHEFSNILGLNQIRFHKGNIKEIYGEVLATIKRESLEEKE